MRNIAFAMLLALAICTSGCASHPKVSDGVNLPVRPFELTNPRPENFGKILPREKGRTFDADELKAATVVKQHGESTEKRQFDARYSLQGTPDGFQVTISYVAHYHEGEPGFNPRGFGGYEVLLSNWSVKPAHAGM